MKTRFIKAFIALFLTLMSLPMLGQDCMEIHLKNGEDIKIYLKNVVEISTSTFDENGVSHGDIQYQHIIMPHKTLVFPLDEIEDIAFTKFYEEVAETNFNSAMTTVLPFLNEYETIEEIENHLESIKNTPGIEDAWSDGHDLHVKVAGFETIVFHICSANAEPQYEQTKPSEPKAVSSVPVRKEAVLHDGKNRLKAVIINQTEKDERDGVSNATKRLHNLEKEFQDYGISTFYNDHPTIDFFYSDIFEYDIIVLASHGGYDKK